ncbi:MAG: hypothetical protein AAGI01_12525 [Myxococcota bacterium]
MSMYHPWWSLGFTALATLTFMGCNTHSVELRTVRGQIQGKKEVSASDDVQMDILWVIDNSGSMCQEQATLATEFDAFIDTLADTTLDFHIAVTTTHAPLATSRALDPIAIEGHIQSTPQVVASPARVCRGFRADDFATLRASISAAIGCTTDPGQWTSLNNLSTDALACAYNPNDCSGVDTSALDRDNSGSYNEFDIFPPLSALRDIPKILKSEDYRMGDGALDVARLQTDFACASFVGTRGYGIEKGLQAAVKAVSPELTGGAVDDEGDPVLQDGDPTAPNHGFIRRNAGFTLIFVSDENDCSNASGLDMDNGSGVCGNVCEFANDPNIPEEESGLSPIKELADEFVTQLKATKGQARGFEDDELVVASIHGSYVREAPSQAVCEDTTESDFFVCNTSLGSAKSGDRYERFMRQFPSFFPRRRTEEYAQTQGISVEEARLDFDNVQEDSAICQGTFRPVLQAISQFLANIETGCISDDVFPCDADTVCPDHVLSDEAGTCQSTDGGKQFCDSGVLLRVQRIPGANVDIEQLDICQPGSIDALRAEDSSCIVDRSEYTWTTCARNANGITFQWNSDPTLVAQKLAGYKLELIYNATVRE